MKKKFLILLFCFGLFFSSMGQVIKSYLKDNITKNKKFAVISILNFRKENSQELLKVFGDSIRKKEGQLAKCFNELEYNSLLLASKKDTIQKNWNENDKINFGFDEITFANDKNKNNNLYKKYVFKKVVYCTLSDAILINNGKNAIFYISRTANWLGGMIERSAIVMKKEKGNWVFVEKVKGLNKFYFDQ